MASLFRSLILTDVFFPLQSLVLAFGSFILLFLVPVATNLAKSARSYFFKGHLIKQRHALNTIGLYVERPEE